MRLSWDSGATIQLDDPAALADALKGWGRAPGSFVVLEAPSGRVLQAAGDTASGFALECLETDESVLRSQRDDLSRAELLRRLQAFLACGGEGETEAPWRQGLRWSAGGEERPDEGRPPGWGRWLRDLLLLMLFPSLLAAGGYWGHLEGERYRSQARQLEMQVLAREVRSTGSKTYTVLTLSATDEALGRKTRHVYAAGSKNQLRHAQVGERIQLWQRQIGSGELRDIPPNGNLPFVLAGMFAFGILVFWGRGVRQGLRVRGRPGRWSVVPARSVGP
ncbi:hypothetical protein J7U46_03510 [Pelomonas sp. V22]|uniref:hypothetical protein n=1 Tax=Pelomonas sp. V22 TaxID=2822139 RepID=UPI0024A80451|nr:hypothetical protein [Pelomonas sp. V22]MDI4632107.1 hypothetical protein [Pelomonas sp. V22]